MIPVVERVATWMVGGAVLASVAMMAAVLLVRIVLTAQETWMRRVQRRYAAVVNAAMSGDAAAIRTLADCPRRHRISVARMVLLPLIDDRRPQRIAAARCIADAMHLVPMADRLLRSRSWVRRAMGMRALGVLQQRSHTAKIVAALDDPHDDIRNTALDALADLQDPAALPALVVRFQDTSLHRGRRLAALAAYGPHCEEFLIALAQTDVEHQASYARALEVCGTAASRPLLCRWLGDPRPAVQAAALAALRHIGLDDAAAPLVIKSLDSEHVEVRAMAAAALANRASPAAAAALARHLDDVWTVAVEAAKALQKMRGDGARELEAGARRSDLAGVLARQMLWETTPR